MTKKKKRAIAVFDLETDPFLFGREPKPFAAGFYDGSEYRDFWGDDCVFQLLQFLESSPKEYYLYAHNGGKFDFIYLVRAKKLQNPVKVINSRIVSAKLGKHILRDSYAILPVPLAAHDKGEIDYAWFESDCRDEHKDDILEYLARDCESLYALVSAFVDRFGVQLTIGGTAIKEVRKYHPFETRDAEHDATFRPYYFGGRVECFERGKIQGDFSVYDVNSMYPFVMSDRLHPTGRDYWDLDADQMRFDKNFDAVGFSGKPYFIAFEGRQFGALPARTKAGLNFGIIDSDDAPGGAFFTMSHEFKTAMRFGLIEVRRIRSILIPLETINFSEFVAINTAEKIAGKKTKDKPREIFAKLLMNSSYGKFGQNPDNFKDYIFRYAGEDLPDGEWELDTDYGEVELYCRPSYNESYYDVATAASVTSAARAVLLEAIQSSRRVIYCDTDSLICENYPGRIDPYELGAWDLEERIDTAFIAGKKLYALYHNGECVKLASKGVRLTGEDVQRICAGELFCYHKESPSFKLSGEASFLTRTIKMLDKPRRTLDNFKAIPF